MADFDNPYTKALQDLAAGTLSLHKAAEKHGIQCSTLSDRWRGVSQVRSEAREGDLKITKS